MTVYTEFSLESDTFPLGQLLQADERDIIVDLERIIEAGEDILSYVWVHDVTPDGFLQQVNHQSSVEEITLLDDLGDRALYRLTLKSTAARLLDAILQAEAAILECVGTSEWLFRLRLPDHACLADFYNACRMNDLDVRFNRIYTMVDNQRDGYLFDLTDPQRAALTRAVEEGYYEIPRRVTLEDLAEELGITRQAASERVRRGAGKILCEVLFGTSSIHRGDQAGR